MYYLIKEVSLDNIQAQLILYKLSDKYGDAPLLRLYKHGIVGCLINIAHEYICLSNYETFYQNIMDDSKIENLKTYIREYSIHNNNVRFVNVEYYKQKGLFAGYIPQPIKKKRKFLQKVKFMFIGHYKDEN